MFGKGKDEGPRLVGAREKIQKAQAKAYGGQGNEISGKKEGKTDNSVLVVLIYVLSSAFAFVLMMGAMKSQGLNLTTGSDSLDRILFSGGVPSVLGSSDTDAIVVPLLRGLFIFVVWGLMPMLTLAWVKIANKPKANPYIMFWTVSLAFLFVFFGVKDGLLHMAGK